MQMFFTQKGTIDMKKIFALVMVLCLCLSLFAGCGGDSAHSYDVKSVVDQFVEAYPVSMSAEINDDTLQDLMQIDLENVEEYYGYRSRANDSVDTVLMIKAKAGKADAVKESLETYRDNMETSCNMYNDAEAMKAKNALITVKGDYLLLTMSGDSAQIEAGQMETIKADIQSKIDELLK